MEHGINDRGPILNGITWSLTALALMFVFLRLTSRTFLSKGSFGLDDALSILSLLVTTATSISIGIAIDAGLGKHFTDLSDAQKVDSMYKITISNCLVVWTFALPKLAIVALLQRTFQIHVSIIMTFWVLSLIGVGATFASSVVWFTHCTPIAHQWDPDEVPGNCWPLSTLGDLSYVVSAFSAFLDLLFAIYPQFTLRELQVPTKHKIAVGTAFATSGLAFIVAVYKISIMKSVAAKITQDPTFELVPLVLWAAVEGNILIVSAALPTLGPFAHVLCRTTPRITSALRVDKESRRRYLYQGEVSNNTLSEDAKKMPAAVTREFMPLSSQGEDIPLGKIHTDTGRAKDLPLGEQNSSTIGRSQEEVVVPSESGMQGSWKKVEPEQQAERREESQRPRSAPGKRVYRLTPEVSH